MLEFRLLAAGRGKSRQVEQVEQVEYGEAAVQNNKAAALLLEGNPRRARGELAASLQLQLRNAQQPWGVSRPAGELEQQITKKN